MKKTKRILLLAPPSESVIIRDYYCSFSAKADYYWPPQDLVILSGILSKNFAVDFIDAVALRLSRTDCLKLILTSADYDAVVFTTGNATFCQDLEFLKVIKDKNPALKLIGSGSIFHFIGDEVIRKFPFIDGIVLDFTNNDIFNFIDGNYSAIKNMFFRKDSVIIKNHCKPEDSFIVPLPLHRVFLNEKCKIIFFQNRPFVTTIGSVGCPYHCHFCCAGSIEYRARDTENLLQELEYIYRNLLISNIFFADPVLLMDNQRSINLMENIINRDMAKLSWVGNVRADFLNEDLIKLSKRAGCRALLVGVESGDQEILDEYNKSIRLEDIEKTFDLCSKYGIGTLAYFILGLPGENKDSLNRTLKLIKKLKSDYISISFAMPDLGTRLRDGVIKADACAEDLYGWDHSGLPYLSSSLVSKEELVDFRRNMYRAFYLRPGRVINGLRDMGCCDFIKGGMELLRK